MTECPLDRTQVAREILAYLSGLPSAEDSLEGIMRRQLPEKPTSRQTILVKEVVADLVTQGRIEKIQEDNRTLYRVRHRH